jgi:hypothetical protein
MTLCTGSKRGKVTETNAVECVFCHRAEVYQHNKKRVVYKPGRDVTPLVCSGCIQKLLLESRDKLIGAYRLALEEGHSDKAAFIEDLAGEEMEKFYDTKTGKARQYPVREKTVRLARPGLRRIGT